jgi:hypothetical protein
MSEIEEWRKISGHDNYEVSNCGNVRNIKTGRILKPWLDTPGYLQVQLSGNGNPKIRIHKLVATAFLGDSGGKTVDHKDRNKLNNNVDNLRYVSQSENNKNQSSVKGVVQEYVKELPADAIVVEEYGTHHFENLYYHDCNFYFFNGVEYRKLTHIRSVGGSYCVRAWTIDDERVSIYLAKYRREIGEIN